MSEWPVSHRPFTGSTSATSSGGTLTQFAGLVGALHFGGHRLERPYGFGAQAPPLPPNWPESRRPEKSSANQPPRTTPDRPQHRLAGCLLVAGLANQLSAGAAVRFFRPTEGRRRS